jgi:hypothetical protein
LPRGENRSGFFERVEGVKNGNGRPLKLLERTTTPEDGRHTEDITFLATQISEMRGEVDCAFVCEFRGEGVDVRRLERVSYARLLEEGHTWAY